MNGESKLKLVVQPQEYFYELVNEALDKHHVKPQPETEFYLVNLLNQFITTDKLYTKDSEGNVRDEPLAIKLKEALEQDSHEVQRSLLRQIGDVSLYTAGYFQDSLSRKLVDVDYYIELGGRAYNQVSHMLEEQAVRKMYHELAEKFSVFVDVLAEISEKTSPKSEKDILRIYDLWLRTKSEKAAKSLQDAGIIPNANIKKDLQ